MVERCNAEWEGGNVSWEARGGETSPLWFRTIAKVLDSEEGRMAGVSEN